MEAYQGLETHARTADTHVGADRRIQHPRRHDGDDARCRLDGNKLTGGARL